MSPFTSLQARNSFGFALIFCVALCSAKSAFTAQKSDLLALPCSKNAIVESYGVLNYLGNATFKAPVNSQGHWQLSMKTSHPFTFLGGWGIKIVENGVKGTAEISSKDAVRVRAGETISFRFRISYSPDSPIPFVSGLQWQGHEICGSQKNPVARPPVRRRRWHIKRVSPSPAANEPVYQMPMGDSTHNTVRPLFQ